MIRTIKKKDFGQLLEVVGRCFIKERQIAGVDLQRLSRVSKLYPLIELLQPIFDFLNLNLEQILVAVSDDRLIGEIHLVPHGKGVWSLDSAAVDETFRRRGVFQKLMRHALRHIHKRGGKRVITSLWADNAASVKVTKRLGFEIFGKQILFRFRADRLSKVESGMRMLVREPLPVDVDKICQICRVQNPRKAEVCEITPEDFLDTPFSRILGSLTWSSSKRWVLEVQGKIVGYVHIIYVQPQEAGRIESFCVLPSEQHLKLSTALLYNATEFLRMRNVKTITVSLDEERKETIELFKSFGFKPVACVYEMMKEPVKDKADSVTVGRDCG